MKTLVLYDGTIHTRKAVAYALEKSRPSSGETIVLHIFNANIFLDYDGGPHALELEGRDHCVISMNCKNSSRIMRPLRGSG